MITDLGHTAFRVHDLAASLKFYGKLGIYESFRLNHTDGTLMLVYLHVGGDRFIELFPGGESPKALSGSFMHLCLVSDSIREDVEKLRSQGIKITSEVSLGLDHNLQAWLADPDGNPIELMQLSEESPQRKITREAQK